MKSIYRQPSTPNRRQDDSSADTKEKMWEKEEGMLLYTDKERRHGVALVLWLEAPDPRVQVVLS